MRRPLPLIIVMASVVGGCTVQSNRLTLCDLPNDRAPLAGRVLTLEGELSVTEHGSGISEPSCDRGIAIGWRQENVPQMREFDAAAQRLEAEPLIVRVRVTGTVAQHPPHDTFPWPYWQLKLTSAEVLSVKPRPAST
jgi:hypothetical protein